MFNFTVIPHANTLFAELTSDDVVYEVIQRTTKEQTYLGCGVVCSSTNRWQIEDTTRQYSNGKNIVFQSVNHHAI